MGNPVARHTCSMTWDPKSVTMIGTAYSRYGNRPFGIRLTDRLQHIYILGQTGTGKSTLLGNLMRQDLRQGHGFCLVDPHGDLAKQIAQDVPPGPSSGTWPILTAPLATIQ